MPALALLAAIALPLTVSAGAMERFIVPVFGEGVVGATGSYESSFTMTNLSAAQGKVRVTKIIPVIAQDRPGYPDSAWTLTSGGTVGPGIRPRIVSGGRQLILGAAVMECDQPCSIESDIYRSDVKDSGVFSFSQAVQLARDWIPAGVESVLPRAVPVGAHSAVKLYLINPNDFAIRFTYSAQNGDNGEETVAAATTAIVILPPEFALHGVFTGDSTAGEGRDIKVKADFAYLAATSTVSLGGIAYPAVVHVARPLTP
jgi:hypothetical protein